MKKPRDNVNARRFPFESAAELERFVAAVWPAFANHTIRENGDGKMGLWNKQSGGYHLFLDHELEEVMKHRETHTKAVQIAMQVILGLI